MKFLATVADPKTSLEFNRVKGSVPIRDDVDVASLPAYQRQASKSLWSDKILLSITHGELMSSDFQQAVYDAVATFVQSKNSDAFIDTSAEFSRGAHCRAMTQVTRTNPVLVVTIKPRLDRLAEAEVQLQSMRRNTLNEPGCVFMHLVQPQDDPDSWVMRRCSGREQPGTSTCGSLQHRGQQDPRRSLREPASE
jgi:hypothetical protein